MKIPAISAEQMAEVDRLMIEEYHIKLIQMMENAGRNLSDCAQLMINAVIKPSILVICGSGNNGGGGLAAARHLINRGLQVEIVLLNNKETLKDLPRHQLSILNKMAHYPVETPNPKNLTSSLMP